MSDSVIDFDDSFFLSDFESFSKTLLPIVNAQRHAAGLPALNEQEAIDYFLDLLNQRGQDPSAT